MRPPPSPQKPIVDLVEPRSQSQHEIDTLRPPRDPREPPVEFRPRAAAPAPLPAAEPVPAPEVVIIAEDPKLPDPAPASNPFGTTPRNLAILARWAGPRIVALAVAALGGGAAAPLVNGSAGKLDDRAAEAAANAAELRNLHTRLATLETERRTDYAIRDRQLAYLIAVLRRRTNTEIRIQAQHFPALPELEIQAPTDTKKPATVDSPFPFE